MIIHIGQYPRQLSLLPKVSDIGHILGKKEILDQFFPTCNFSFIIRGSGWFSVNNKKYRVQAPAILIQWPGVKFLYGPDTDWDEFFFIYRGEEFKKLKSTGLFDIQNPVKPFYAFAQTNNLLKEVFHLVETNSLHATGDRIDLLCWQAICESPLSESLEEVLSENEKKIELLVYKIKDNPIKKYDFIVIAEELGMAYSTFRRHWVKFTGVSPLRYISDIKLGIACKLLSETNLSVSEIASKIDINDSLYFSRFFKKKTGRTPSEYRRSYNLK
ncbi:MAG: helix-turn-helix domain-containing protein [Spirochaetales bacterium]|nr:helix-turn-helix domain-containing protein [Spirochaetales bacterium]